MAAPPPRDLLPLDRGGGWVGVSWSCRAAELRRQACPLTIILSPGERRLHCAQRSDDPLATPCSVGSAGSACSAISARRKQEPGVSRSSWAPWVRSAQTSGGLEIGRAEAVSRRGRGGRRERPFPYSLQTLMDSACSARWKQEPGSRDAAGLLGFGQPKRRGDWRSVGLRLFLAEDAEDAVAAENCRFLVFQDNDCLSGLSVLCVLCER